MVLGGLVNKLFRHKEHGDYLYVFEVEEDRVIGLVVDRAGLPANTAVVPKPVWVKLDDLARDWEERPGARMVFLVKWPQAEGEPEERPPEYVH